MRSPNLAMHCLRSVENPAIVARLNGISMRNNVQRPCTSIATMASRTLFALAAALPMAVAADVTINITATRPQAFESNPSNYGEIQVTRSAALTSPLAVTLQLNTGFTTGKYADYFVVAPATVPDFTLQLNPADAANATLDLPGTLANPSLTSVRLTFNSGYSNARIQVIAVPDVAVYPPELAEIVTLSNPIIPPSSGIVVGGNQRGTVTIVDANVQVQTYVDQSPAREILKDDINNYVQGAGDGRMRLWFPNSSAFPPATPPTPTTSYSTYGNRFVEISNAGSSATAAVDFVATYRIGGNQRCVESFGVVIEPTVTVLRNALRETTEYGAVNFYINSTTNLFFPGYTDSFSGQVIATNIAQNLSSISVESFTIPTGSVVQSIDIGANNYIVSGPSRVGTISYGTVNAGSLSGKNIISLQGFTVPAPLGEGTGVILHYTTSTTTGTPPVTTTTPGDATTKISMPILYPIGARSISVTQGASPVQLSKGDVFVVDGWAYRVTGTKLNSGGGGSLGDYEIFFNPGLRKDLLRTSPLTIQTHFEAKFDNNGRETFLIPALPTSSYFGYPNGQSLDPLNLDEAVRTSSSGALPLIASDLPNGDWVDLLFRPIDDNIVEGREDILISLGVTTANNGYDVISPTVADIPLGDNDVIVDARLASNAQVPTGDGAFLIELSQGFPDQVLVPFTILQNGGTDAIFGTDYSVDNAARDSNGNVSGVVIVPKGTLSVIVNVKPLATSTLAVNQSKSVRIALDDSLDYALAGSVSSGTNASAATVTITKTPSNTNPVPLIKSPLSVSWTIGDAKFFYQILADNVPPVSYDAIGLPTGLTVNKNNGTISGTPTAVGDYTVLLKAITATGGFGSANLTISIKPQAAPVVSSPLTASGTTNVGFSYQIVANGSPVSYNATGLPAGLVVDKTTGAITGTPTASGPSTVTITATNSSNNTGSATLVITIAVGAVPVISSPLTATATAGAAFTYQIVASGNPTSYNATPLPAGLSVNLATGAISGTPTTAGTSSVTISAVNAGGTTSATLVITVNTAALPIISSVNTAAAVVGTAFSYQITASGSPTAYSASGLPAGLSVSTTTGIISGTPTAVGSSPVTIGATNSGGTGTATLVISVTATPTGTTTGTPAPAPGNGDGGVCGAGSGLAALLGSLSLMLMRLTGRRR